LKQGVKSASILQYNAENALPFAEETFDCVLVDAPCSGTGTIRHNPEIRYSLKEEDLRDLSFKQLNILENASKTLKKGGRLIYSTCSLEKEENESVVGSFLEKNRDFRKDQLSLPAQFLTENGYARTFPQRDKTDGFFIAQLEKN
jgi:16S rRNA (cytosine967-C5)-methyltransferase